MEFLSVFFIDIKLVKDEKSIVELGQNNQNIFHEKLVKYLLLRKISFFFQDIFEKLKIILWENSTQNSFFPTVLFTRRIYLGKCDSTCLKAMNPLSALRFLTPNVHEPGGKVIFQNPNLCGRSSQKAHLTLTFLGLFVGWPKSQWSLYKLFCLTFVRSLKGCMG